MSTGDTPSWNIRGYLMAHPKPATVRVTNADGEVKDIKRGSTSWQKLADTVAALGPELIECLDEGGEIIRAVRPERELQRSQAADIPKGLEADPSALLLTHFANLIHRAYEHSVEIAFNKLVDLTDRLNERSEGIERRLERSEATGRQLQQERIDDLLDRAQDAAANAVADGGDGQQAMLASMLQSFLGGAMQRKGVPNGSSNGKASA